MVRKNSNSERKLGLVHDILHINKMLQKENMTTPLIGGKYKISLQDMKKPDLSALRNDMLAMINEKRGVKYFKKKGKKSKKFKRMKKRHLAAGIMHLRRKLKKAGVNNSIDGDIRYMSKAQLKAAHSRLAKKYNKKSGKGYNDSKITQIPRLHQRLYNDRNEMIYDVNTSLSPISAEPFRPSLALEARDELADKIKQLMGEVGYVRPGMVGMYHNGGSKKMKIIKCPGCNTDVVVKGGTKKKRPAVKRAQTAKSSEWMNLVKQVSKMPENKGRSRAEIMKIASEIRKKL